jgi:hypothetical protein
MEKFIKDEKSNAIINVDEDQYRKFQMERAKLRQTKTFEAQIRELAMEIKNIQITLSKLVNN